jgi:homoserine kinase type II
MAVYTDVADEDLTRFLADYDVGDLLSYRGIAEGVENSNFLVHADSGPYILTLYEKRVDTRDLPFFLGLMNHLAAAGITCPVAIADREGNTLRELAGRPAALISFLEGVWVRKPQPTHCGQVGAALASFHLATEGFSLTRPNALAQPDWRPLFQSCRDGADGVQAGLETEIDQELASLEQAWPEGLPGGVIHADLFPDNVFFLKDQLSGIIDFYFACNETLAYDIAICLNAWCFEPDNSFNITKARALLRGYMEVRPLDKDELSALPVLARGSALRFLLTRLFDWINTPDGALVRPHDPLEYVRKLRFHQKIANASEYGIDV